MGFHPVVGNDNVVAVCHLPEERFAYVELSLMGQAQICIGDEFTCEDRYTYPNPGSAIKEFLIWVWVNHCKEEPEGWHRHQPSNRRRKDGDPTQEYIRP